MSGKKTTKFETDSEAAQYLGQDLFPGTDKKQSQRRQAASTVGASGAALMQFDLNASTKFKFEVYAEQGRLAALTDQEKGMSANDAIEIEKALYDLYPIFMRHEPIRIKAAQADLWSHETKPWQVLSWLMEQYIELLPENTHAQLALGQGKYAIENIYEYPEVKSWTVYAMPMCFLPKLKKYNTKLHQLMIDAVALFTDTCHVYYFYYEEWILEYFLNEIIDDDDLEENERKELDETISLYSSGIVKKYKEFIGKAVKKANIQSFKRELNSINAKNSIETDFQDLASDALALFQHDAKLSDFYSDDYEEEGLFPDQYIFFNWSLDDRMFQETLATIENEANHFPVIPPWKRQTLTGSGLETIAARDPFPVMLINFIEKGVNLCEQFMEEG